MMPTDERDHTNVSFELMYLDFYVEVSIADFFVIFADVLMEEVSVDPH